MNPLQPIQLDPGVLYETRLIMFLETGPQTNEYRQICLTNEQFKKIQMTLQSIFSVPQISQNVVIGAALTVIDDFIVEMDDRIRSHYPPRIGDKLSPPH